MGTPRAKNRLQQMYPLAGARCSLALTSTAPVSSSAMNVAHNEKGEPVKNRLERAVSYQHKLAAHTLLYILLAALQNSMHFMYRLFFISMVRT